MSQKRVAVVGGGIIGLTSAYALVEAGFDVTVFDAAACGNLAATVHSLGSLLPYPFTKTHNLAKTQRKSLQIWPELAQKTGITSYVPCGRLQVATTPGQAEHTQESVAASGGLQTALSAQEIQKKYPEISAPYGGFFCTLSAKIDPREACCRLAAIIRHKGGKVAAISRQLDWRAAELQDFDQIVVAAGVGSPAFLAGHPQFDPKHHMITPVKGQALRVKLPCPAPPMIVRSREVYLVPTGLNEMLIGSTSENVGFDVTPTAAARDTLLAGAVALLPAVAQGEVIDHWAGLRPKGVKGMPLVQRVDERFILAAGHYKIGLCLAPVVGRLVAECVGFKMR